MDTQATAGNGKQEPQKGSRRRFWLGLVSGVVLGALFATSASVYSHWGWRHRHGGMDPATVSERAGFMTEWVLRKVDASDEQQEQVNAIVEATITDLFPLKDQHRANREAMRAALSQPTIDRQALENIRQSELQLVETMSSTIVEAVANAAEVLTPEQRTELAELAARFHGKHKD